MSYRQLRLARAAVEGVAARPLRSSLAALGLMVGVAAVVVMVAVASGARNQVLGSVEALGSNLLTVRARKMIPTGARATSVSELTTLTLLDAAALYRLDGVKAGAAKVEKAWRASLGENMSDTTVVAAPCQVFEIEDQIPVEGRLFNQPDERARRRVAVIGPSLRKTLAGEESLLGQYITINKQPFMVIGELAEKGTDPSGGDLDDRAYIPLSTALSRLMGGRRHVDQVTLQAYNRQGLMELEGKVRSLLRQRHRLRPGQKDDFRLFTQIETIKMQEESSRMFTGLTVGVAMLSLVVAGIGIMAVMLISVRERTPEIGVRKAVGARRGDLLAQFILEALMLGLAGGLSGAGLGLASAAAIRPLADMSFELPWLASAAALGLSLTITLFFGIYPARRAASMPPAQAVRSG